MASLLLSIGCWREHEPAIDYDRIPLDNPHVEDTQIWVQAFDSGIPCPDMSTAPFYAVYPESLEDPARVAVLFHSGAFDYVINPSPLNRLEGTHYTSENRLTATWARERVFYTLGMWSAGTTTYEAQDGALVVALARQGFLTLLPGNCWGDLWHNEVDRQKNDEALDGFQRNGRGLAWWMLRIVFEDDFASSHGFDMPIEIDDDQVWLLGLGDGGRAIPELLLRTLNPADYDIEPEIAGFMMDSTPDDLSYWASSPSRETQYKKELDALDHIMPLAGTDTAHPPLGYYSLLHILGGTPQGDDGGPAASVDLDWVHQYVVWSRNDNDLVDELIEPTAALLEQRGGTVEDTRKDGHTFSNSDIAIANRVVRAMLGLE
jgi:hypothetical protein